MSISQTEQSQALWKAPAIPNKYDIIPIHNSDRGSFKRCRRYWDWTSPARNNLSLRTDVHGVNTDLWFGTGVHYALENFYQPGLGRDPVEVFKTWFDIQWKGGVVTREWLDLVYDLKSRDAGPQPELGDDHLYEVRGLQDIIPDVDVEKFEELYKLGVNMMQAYKGYAEKYDGFEMLVAEHDFSVPIWDYENDCILKAVDVREQSPNCGKLLEVHSRGRMDGIWVKPNGKPGIIDHKTSGRIDEEFFEKLDTDEQCTTYLYAAEVEAKYYDLPYRDMISKIGMEEVIYNVLRKTYPQPPTVVRGGLFSVDRANESCTYEMLMEWCRSQDPPITVFGAPDEISQGITEKHQSYVAWLRDSGDEQFFIRKHVRRNRHQIRNAGYRMYLEAMDMLDPNVRIYPNLRNDWQCLHCAFRAPCLMQEDGSDYESYIEHNYSRNRDR